MNFADFYERSLKKNLTDEEKKALNSEYEARKIDGDLDIPIIPFRGDGKSSITIKWILMRTYYLIIKGADIPM